ncbi:MAG: hypothetical protein VX980_04985 [Actinomycetota bacterium]|nr:hypothetical protein [Actinomycetota bacterium]
MSVQPTGQSPLDARAREVENLAAAVRRLEREKRALQEWTATLERPVVAPEVVGRDREAERVAEVRVRTQELAAVERRLARTLESQSFRLGHLLICIVVSPVKALRWTRRHVRTAAVRGYRLAQRRLPGYVVDPVQRVATRGQLATARRHEVLDLAGDRPVSFVDCRGLEELARDALWARIAASDQPDRTVVLVDSPDFTDLRTLGLSFEYLPPYRPDLPWWCDEADHARWVEDRMAAMRLGYGVEDDAGH